jgi:hypothetical protein
MADRPVSVKDMEGVDWWRVTCERCRYVKNGIKVRTDAIKFGREHSARKHPDKYAFRVQGFKAR